MRIREACEKLADSAIAHAGILIGVSGISRLWQGHVDAQVACDREIMSIMAANDMTYEEAMIMNIMAANDMTYEEAMRALKP